MSAFDDMTENMKVKILKDTIEKLENEKEKLEAQNFEMEAKLTQLTKMSIEQVGRYLEKDLEIKELKKQLTRKTNLHNKTAKRLSRSRMESRAQKAIADYRGDALEKQEHEIDLLKVRLESSKRNSEDLQKCLDDSRMVADGWKKQFEILENKVKSMEEAKKENWELSVKYWRNKYEDVIQGWTKSVERNVKTDERLRVIRKQRKYETERNDFYTKLNRAAYRENQRLTSQVRKLQIESEDGRHFKNLEKSYDELYDRHQDALAQIQHETRLADYSDSYINDLEKTRSKLGYEIEQLKEDLLHVVRISRKG